jgi:hypothetical protein
MARKPALARPKQIEQAIYFVRGHKVMLDEDLARLYGVETRGLIQAVKRNLERFPADFMFQLSIQEFRDLKSQTVTSSWGGRRTLPYAFTEHGALMLSSVLNSPTAVEASIEVARTFIRMRQLLSGHQLLAQKITALEQRYNEQFRVVFDAIRELMVPPEPRKKTRIGF